MTDHEKEIGQILEGIKNLNHRYAAQEARLSNVEKSMSELCVAFASQPSKCLAVVDEKFVTKEKLKPLEETHKLIKKASLYLFCSFVVCLAIAVEYIRRS